MATAGLDVVIPRTRAGRRVGSAGTPRPSSPPVSSPQHLTVPPDTMAQEKPAPVTTAVAPVTPAAWTGVVRLAVPPSPSSLLVSEPQHHTVPSARTAQVCVVPALTALALEIPLTATGWLLEWVVPS